MKLFVSTGNSRMEKRWNGTEMELEEFTRRISATIRTSETVEQYRKLSKAKQDDIKDVGGFVLGKLKGGRRKKDCVVFRSGLTLDMDYARSDIPEQIEIFFDFRCLIYFTHKHTAENPRLRLVIPLSRNVSPDEYAAVARKGAEDIGMELFDDTTYELSRLMYWPSTSADGEFVFRDIEGEILNPDRVLSRYKDWRDSSEWPVSSRQQSVVQREMKMQADPLAKDGVVGAFSRTYGIEEAVETFLPEIYQPSAMPGRYDYVPADSQAGVVVYEGKFAFSHHATDPACGKLMNAFDMVRIHRFGGLDSKASEDTEAAKLPSFKAMSEFAVADERVKLQLAKEREESAKLEFLPEKEWQSALELDRQGRVKDTLDNLVLAIRNDGKLQSIAFNLHRDGIDAGKSLPWKQIKPGWNDSDFASLKVYLNKGYGVYSPAKTKDELLAVASERAYHPVKEYLDKLPGMKKTDVETVKSFLSRVDDKYRASYGLNVESHPRQCVIVGSTNTESGFLRDITGNRRFWPVRVNGQGKRKPWQITAEEVTQIWAEAVSVFKAGEKLFLEGDVAAMATSEQAEAMETDDREGLVRTYLDTLLPETWDTMSLYDRRNFLNGSEFGGEARNGSVRRTTACNMEIWCECFGRDSSALKKIDSYEISGIMRKIEGWGKYTRAKNGMLTFPIYGKQRAYIREQE